MVGAGGIWGCAPCFRFCLLASDYVSDYAMFPGRTGQYAALAAQNQLGVVELRFRALSATMPFLAGIQCGS